jgi:hypothetical protein
MKMKPLFLLLCATPLACGEGYTPHDGPVCNASVTPQVPLSRGLSGHWDGTGVLTGAPDTSFTLPMVAHITLNGAKGVVRMTGLCTEESSLTIYGCENFAGWGGTIECTRPVGDCPDVRTTYTRGQLHGKDSGESVEFVLEGTVVGCGMDQSTQLVFTGHKETEE